MLSTEVIKCPAFRLSQLGQLPEENVCAETGMSGKNMALACPFKEANVGGCEVNLSMASTVTRGRIADIVSTNNSSVKNRIGNF